MKISGYILSNSSEFYGELEIKDDKILSIVEKNKNEVEADNLIIPGFIDLHSHGAKGYDVMDASCEALENISKFHLNRGTTSYFPTTVTAEIDDIINTVKICNDFINNKNSNVDGIHLEGPFINKNKLGAQPDCSQIFDIEELKKIIDVCPIKIITASPEIGDYSNFLDICNKNDIRVQIGHSTASYEQACKALDDGFAGCTHLFNALSGFNHRDPGVVGAIFDKGNYSEIICDLKHVHKAAVTIAANNIPNLYIVSDTCAATGMGEGKFRLGGNTVFIKDGAVYLNDDVLAGSCSTIYDMFKNLISIGFSEKQACLMTSYRAAKYAGLDDKGDLKQDMKANLVVLNKDNYDIKSIWFNGKKV